MIDFKSDQKSSPFSSDKSKAEQHPNLQKAAAQIPEVRPAEKISPKQPAFDYVEDNEKLLDTTVVNRNNCSMVQALHQQ